MMMMWQIILLVILVQFTEANILVRPFDQAKKPRNVRTLNQAATASDTPEGGCWIGFD